MAEHDYEPPGEAPPTLYPLSYQGQWNPLTRSYADPMSPPIKAPDWLKAQRGQAYQRDSIDEDRKQTQLARRAGEKAKAEQAEKDRKAAGLDHGSYAITLQPPIVSSSHVLTALINAPGAGLAAGCRAASVR
ncbi:hypothetical protein [Nocardia sp. NPDC050710]|uniref:hypothetical protein n=1 Tax=Nocardia sp. NPDC050710 TaxID=3157220 RepID=UPI0033F23DE4